MTIVFALSWLGEEWRIVRYQKWLAFQLSIQKELGFDKIILVDNASNIEDLKTLNATIYDDQHNLIHKADSCIEIYRFPDHIPRTRIHEYPYCWRGLDYCKKLVNHYNLKKIIFLDSDFYILTSKLASYVKSLDKGWTSWWCHKYGWPEAAFNVLCNMDLLLQFDIPSFTYYNNQHMEELLPFTQVLKTEFKGDRSGEGAEPQTPDMDFYGQWSINCPDMKFDLSESGVVSTVS